MSPDIAEQLRMGIQAAQKGQREQAQAILMQVVEQDQNNVKAWLWLSGVVDDLEDQQICLENVLALDPTNTAAQQGLTSVRARRAQSLLKQGITLAQAGQREQARHVLTQVVALDEKNVSAWLWLSGVVDDLQEREICLQNVLDLEPNHAAARKGLAQIQAQRAAQSARREEYEQIVEPTPSPPPPPPRSVLGELNDPLLCPYCAVPTELSDRRCRLCDGKLWIEVGMEDKQPSVWLWILIVLQGINALISGLNLFGVLIRFASTSAHTSRLPVVSVLSLGSAFVISVGLAIGLYMRWRWIYYLYLVNSILSLISVALMFVLGIVLRPLLLSAVKTLADQQMVDFLSRFYLAIVVFMAIGAGLGFLLVLAVKGDFEGEKVRLLLDVDPRIKTPSACLRRGRELLKQKIWALAALYLARSIQPEQLDGRAALAYACVKIKRYDLAQTVLAEARRISPQNAELQEIQNMLDELRQKALHEA